MTKARQKQRKKAQAAEAKVEAIGPSPSYRGPRVTKCEFLTTAEAFELLDELLHPPTLH
jgi:hypothetical protein